MNNNWRLELTGRLFLYFVQTRTVRMENLEIGYEQKLHEGRPYVAQLFSPSCHFLSLFDQTLPPPRKRMTFLNDPFCVLTKQIIWCLRTRLIFSLCGSIFVNSWNCRRIRSQIKLQLLNVVTTHMFSFLEQHGGTQKCSSHNFLMQEVPIQLGLCIDIPSTTAYNFFGKEFLRNHAFFLPDPIEIPSNEKIKVYPFLEYSQLEICKFYYM